MPKKLTILGALTAVLVFGYMGLFANSNAQAGGQVFDATVGAITEIDVIQCYDTDAGFLNSPVQAPPTGGAITGRVSCDTANPSPLPIGSTPMQTWTVINLPPGNRLTLPTTFTPSGPGQWQYDTITCTAGPPFNECSDPGALDTGDITSRTDIGCNTPIFDILGKAGGTGGVQNSVVLNDGVGWGNEPNETEARWPMPQFDRIAQAATLPGGGAGVITGGPNAYVHQIVPFPSTWTFRSSDLSILTSLYIGAGGLITIPITRLNTAAYEFPATGLVGQVALLAGSPDNPPSDSLTTCALQSPQFSISENDTFVSPVAATRIPRWTTLQSDFDRADATGPDFEDGDLTRILDWQCDVFGVPADGDTDGDCYPNAADPNDGNVDNDGDQVPDGVEIAYGSNPAIADTDTDGCNDYCEVFQLTSATNPDTDGDGSADKPDDTPTNCVGACTGDDAPTTGTDAITLTDDNCPTEANPSQLNTDSMFQFHGMGVGTGDATNPDEDVDGDACDTDADNDGIPGATENVSATQMNIQPWGGYGGASGTTSVCVAGTVVGSVEPNGTAANPVVMSDTTGDVDQDYVLDGAECQFRSRPDASVRLDPDADLGNTVLNCNSGAAPLPAGPQTAGCAQPGVKGHSVGNDPDSDGLYLPGSTGDHSQIEKQFRAMCFNQANGTCTNDIDDDDDGGACGVTNGLANGNGDGDSDSDRDVKGLTCKAANLKDGLEVLVYGTFPADTDTDQDGCPDGDEVDDITGDGNTSSGDQGSMVSKFALGPLDNNADGKIDDYLTGLNADLNKDGLISSGDQGLLAASISASGNCTVAGAFAEDNVDITSIMRLP